MGIKLISIDSIILFLFTGLLYRKILILSTFWGTEQLKYATVSLIFILLLVYLLYDYLHKDSESKYKVKCLILSVFFFFFIIYPLFTAVVSRKQSSLKFGYNKEMVQKFPGGYKVDPDLAAYLLLRTDSLFATEQAIAFVVEGKNPYRENYSDTLMKTFGEDNPAFVHYVYLPAMFLIPAPFYLAWKSLFGWYDHRIFQLLFYFGTLFVLACFIKDKSKKLLLVILFALNPLILKDFLSGFNDTLLLFWIFLSLLLLEKKMFTLSLISFAVACSLKQFSWFFIPFYFLRFKSLRNLNWKDLLIKSYPFYIVFGLFIVPFIIWDFGNFTDDVFKCLIGKSTINYPIGQLNEYGVCQLLINLGFIESGKRFPFWVLQLFIGVPLCGVLLVKQHRKNTLVRLLAGGTLTLFTFSFFSGIFHVNYIGVIVFLVLFIWVLRGHDT